MKQIGDFFSYIFTLTPALITYYGAFLFLQFSFSIYLKLLILPIIILTLFIITVFLLRIIFIPKMKAGVYPPGLNRGFISWYLNLALSRAIHVAKLKEVIYSFYIFKYLYFRAMGANVAFNIDNSMSIELRDFPLISIGKNSVITDGVLISCHIFVKDKLYLGKVTIGEKCYIGMHTIIGAGSKIGNNCFIGGYNKMHNTKVKDNTKIENFQWEKGNS